MRCGKDGCAVRSYQHANVQYNADLLHNLPWDLYNRAEIAAFLHNPLTVFAEDGVSDHEELKNILQVKHIGGAKYLIQEQSRLDSTLDPRMYEQ